MARCHPDLPLPTANYDAIVVMGGGQTDGGPPPHVAARLELALRMYSKAAPKPKIIVSGQGTVYKPSPRDARGYCRHECHDNARWLIDHGVPATDILEECVSLDTTGNAIMIRILHTDVRALHRLVVITSDWHMPRTRAVCDFVFGLGDEGPHAKYTIEYQSSSGMLPADVLNARLAKEERDLPRYRGPWQDEVLAYGSGIAAAHSWLFNDNYAHCSGRLLCSRSDPDPILAQSY
jgi:uncharacterized SAM-binding protein YcdF (DUF218 family)